MNEATAKTATLVEIARMYYEHHLSQQQIAEKLGISRPGVSRMLRQAREQRLVFIEIRDPADRGTQLEERIQDLFKLKKVVVVPNEGVDDVSLKHRLAQSAVKFLDPLIKEGITLGVSWGTTLQAVVKQLQPRPVSSMQVVQLVGGFTQTAYNTHAIEITQNVANNYQASPFLLPLPAIVDHEEVKKTIIRDRNMARSLKLGHQAEAALFSIGSFTYHSSLLKAHYFNSSEVDDLLAKGVVGDICTHLINDRGEICSPELDARTIGIELENLKHKPYSIAVAGGIEKLKAIHAGLLGGYFNVLITDEIVGGNLIALNGKRDISRVLNE